MAVQPPATILTYSPDRRYFRSVEGSRKKKKGNQVVVVLIRKNKTKKSFTLWIHAPISL